MLILVMIAVYQFDMFEKSLRTILNIIIILNANILQYKERLYNRTVLKNNCIQRKRRKIPPWTCYEAVSILLVVSFNTRKRYQYHHRYIFYKYAVLVLENKAEFSFYKYKRLSKISITKSSNRTVFMTLNPVN